MGRSFDEINDSIDIADNSVLTLTAPTTGVDGWTITFWVKLPSGNTGSLYKYIFSWGSVGSGNANVNIVLHEDTAPSADQIEVFCYSGASNGGTYTTSGAPAVDDGDWHHICINCFQFGGDDYVATYIDGTQYGSVNTVGAIGDINVAGNPRIGGRIDGNADRYYGGYLAEFAILDFAVSASGGTLAPLTKASPIIYADNLQCYLPMVNDNIEIANGLALTNNGSTAANDHPPVMYPQFVQYGGQVVDTASIVPGLMSQFRRRRLHPCAA